MRRKRGGENKINYYFGKGFLVWVLHLIETQKKKKKKKKK